MMQGEKRLRQDFQSSFPKANSENRGPTFSSYLTRIPYLEAVIEETLRYGGATTALQHLSKVDTQILRYDIPKKMDVLFLAHGPIVFTPGFEIDESKRSQTYQAAGEKKGQAWDDQDIGAFKPERWLG
ncbi:hypothetical protein NXS19_006736 [Fusarium pseudograminearum]|nr:hypothetical protein NXS19_006736 [Fusarium pseudograminearum]